MNNTIKTSAPWASGLLAIALPFGQALAAHSDIEVEDIIGGKINLHLDDAEFDFATGNAIYEAEFGENVLLPHQTDEPGFASEDPGPFAPDTYVRYRTHGSLMFWDGLSWDAADPSVSLHVLGNFFEDSIYTNAGLFGDATGLVGVTDIDGGLHSHVEFCVENQGLVGCPDSPAEIAANTPAIGAYLIEMSLFGTDATGSTVLLGDSDPFFIAFNNGLSEVAFEEGIEALTAVPVPAAVWLFGSGLLGLVGVARRKIA